MKNELYDQLIGSVYRCKEYSQAEYAKHYAILKDGDEFSAAASLYADERNELLANSLHKYQSIIDNASEALKLETDFLLKKKVCFNFYTDIANLFGLGTQAYTTETETPYIGVSELSLQDVYLLQLILVHELQHAMDFVFFDGFNMGIAERELRARITICNSLNEIQKQFSKLYKNAYVDQAYWFTIMFASPTVENKVKEEYYELLEKKAKKMLEEDDGIVFSPLILRVFGRELNREGVDLKANMSYRIFSENGKLSSEISETKKAIPQNEMNEMEEHIASDIETYQDNEPLSAKLAKLTGENITGDKETVPLTKNKMMEWHTYKDEFKNLNKQASVVITRNSESFVNILKPQDTSIGVPNIIKVQPQGYLKGDDNSLKELKNLDIPNASYNFNQDETVIVTNNPYMKGKKENMDDDIAQNMVNNLSDFFGKKRD